MSNFRGPASFVMVATIVSALSAETRCPESGASLPFRPINRYQIIVPVSINHSGPYNFILDTGTEITIIDPSLAAELHLDSQGPAKVVGAGLQESVALARLDQTDVGTYALANQQVMVYDLGRLRSASLPIRGILGWDFLGRFDLLIDNAHRLLCIGNSASMRADVKGPHIPLVTPAQTAGGGRAVAQVAHRCGSPARRNPARSAEARLRHERPLPLQRLSMHGTGHVPGRIFARA